MVDPVKNREPSQGLEGRVYADGNLAGRGAPADHGGPTASESGFELATDHRAQFPAVLPPARASVSAFGNLGETPDRAHMHPDVEAIRRKLISALGQKYETLALEPGIMARVDEFIEFARQYLKGADPSAAQLFEAFAQKLGEVEFYRGTKLWDEDAEKILADGMDSNFLRLAGSDGDAMRLIAEKGLDALVEDHVRGRLRASPFLSVTSHPAIALFVPYSHGRGRGERDTFVFKVRVRVIDTVPVKQNTVDGQEILVLGKIPPGRISLHHTDRTNSLLASGQIDEDEARRRLQEQGQKFIDILGEVWPKPTAQGPVAEQRQASLAHLMPLIFKLAGRHGSLAGVMSAFVAGTDNPADIISALVSNAHLPNNDGSAQGGEEIAGRKAGKEGVTIADLTPRPLPATPPDASQILARREVYADKVQIAGRFVEFLHKLARISDDEILKRWDMYLDYADAADPVSSARVLSKLAAVSGESESFEQAVMRAHGGYSVKGTASNMLWRLAVSLHRSGYIDESLRLFDRVFELNSNIEREDRAYANLDSAVDVGLWEHISRYADSVNGKAKNGAFLKWMIEAAGKTKNSRPPDWFILRIDKAVKELDEENHAFNILDACFKSAVFFRIGLKYMELIKSADSRAYLFEKAAANLPADFTDEERSSLADSYMSARDGDSRRIRDGGFDETYFATEEKRAAKRDFKLSHNYWKHSMHIAAVFLAARDPSLRQRGLQMLEELPEQNTAYVNCFMDRDERFDLFMDENTKFRPALWKAISYQRLAPLAPPEDRKRMLKNALDLLNSADPIGMECVRAAYGIGDIATLATLYGYHDLAQEALLAWDGVKNNSGLLRATKVHHEIRSLEKEWDKRQRLVNLQMSFMTAVSGGSKAIDKWLWEISSAEGQGRAIYPRSGLLYLIRSFSNADANRGMEASDLRKITISLSRTAIENFIRTTATEEMYGDRWSPIVNTLMDKKMPVTGEDRDALVAYLIDLATPRKGVYRRKILSGANRAWEGMKALQFVLGNKEMPRSDAMLIERIRDLAEDVGFNRIDWRFQPTFEGLHWVFGRIGDSQYLDPRSAPILAPLRASREYNMALRSLFSFYGDDPAAIDRPDVVQRFNSAIETNDAAYISSIKSELRALINIELVETTLRKGDSPHLAIGKKCRSVDGTFAADVYEKWLGCIGSLDQRMAGALLDIWVPSLNDEERDAKKILYYKALGDPRVSLASKRRVYEELNRTSDVSKYEEDLWGDIRKSGDETMESLFYDLIAPKAVAESSGSISLIGAATDILLALVFEKLPVTFDRDALVRDFTQYRQDMARYEEGNRTNGKPHFEGHNPGHWILQAALANYCPYQKLETIFTLLASRALGTTSFWHKISAEAPYPELDCWPRVQEMARELLLSYHHEYFADGRHNEDPLYYLNNDTSFRADAGDADRRSLRRMPAVFAAIDAAMDSIVVRSYHLPASIEGIISKRGKSLAEFMLTRLFTRIDVGEQQRLLSKIENAPEGTALKIFFEDTGLEKIGQFLSYWPQVPESIRMELKELQDKVVPTSYGEIRSFIMEQLGITDDHELITNMDAYNAEGTALLGSGTIGECYRSWVTVDGKRQEVVIKAVHPSKEAKFRSALEKVRAVRHLMGLYLRETPGSPRYIPHIRQAHRLITLYLDMVEDEFNLIQEAKNADEMRNDLNTSIGVPRYLCQFSREKVAVQTYMNGVKLDDIPDPDLRLEAIAKLKEYLIEQVMSHGVYHSDLQPGNILVEIDRRSRHVSRVNVIDFGQVGRLGVAERRHVSELLAAIGGQNDAMAVRALRSMGESGAHFDEDGLKDDVRNFLSRHRGGAEDMPSIVSGVFDTSLDRGLEVGLPYVRLLKAFATFDATASSGRDTTSYINAPQMLELSGLAAPTQNFGAMLGGMVFSPALMAGIH